MPAPGQHNPVYADLYQPHPLASEDVPQEYDDFDKDYKMLMDGDEELLRDPEFQEEMRRVRASRKGRRNAQNLRYRQLLSTKSYHGVGQPAQSGKIPQPQRGPVSSYQARDPTITQTRPKLSANSTAPDCQVWARVLGRPIFISLKKTETLSFTKTAIQ